MITKARQHDTDRAGRLIIEREFQKLNFVATATTDDYGIDYNIQAFDGEHPTGAWFHVQLKSTESAQYVKEGAVLTYSLDIGHLLHYAIELKQPIFLVVVDVRAGRSFYFSPQLSAQSVLQARDRGQSTLTLSIPIGNELPRNASGLLGELRSLYTLLAGRELMKASLADFNRTIPLGPEKAALRESLQDKNDLMKLHRMHELYLDGKMADASRRVIAMIEDPDAGQLMKYQASTQLNAMEWSSALRSGSVGATLAEAHFAHARRLRSVASRKDSWVRLAALLVKSCAELDVLVYQNGADSMALEQHLRAGSPFLIMLGLHARRADLNKRIVRKYNQAVRLTKIGLTSPQCDLLVPLFQRIPMALAPYLAAVRKDEQLRMGQVLADSCFEILKLSVKLAQKSGDERSIGIAVICALTLSEDVNPEARAWALDVANSITSEQEREAALLSIERQSQRKLGVRLEGDYNPDPIWQILCKIAFSMGVDISDESSLLVRRLRIAAKDEEPERHLRYCEHIIVTLGAISPVDRFITRMFGVSTSSNKVVHCNLFNLHKEGTDSDEAFHLMHRNHCERCSSRVPRPPTWSYTEAARLDIERHNTEFVARSTDEGFGLRYTGRDDLEPGA